MGGAGDDAVFRQTLVLLERADAALSACTAAHPGLSAGLSADLSAGALGANMETCSPETWARFNCLSMVRRGGGGGVPHLRPCQEGGLPHLRRCQEFSRCRSLCMIQSGSQGWRRSQRPRVCRRSRCLLRV